ncbi:hypothetical protein CYMTET_34068 [Cymbomonas tetramitiformis]|uniref:Uncharacterized protein n=1 Tax=Cymbomonas tetramitiformis TaxID=36881 RepID=A0AAE0KQB3_9CHLO|nr:hypothetical protein CYMTET_34068 [Cymbomonas tetramitiformis]
MAAVPWLAECEELTNSGSSLGAVLYMHPAMDTPTHPFDAAFKVRGKHLRLSTATDRPGDSRRSKGSHSGRFRADAGSLETMLALGNPKQEWAGGEQVKRGCAGGKQVANTSHRRTWRRWRGMRRGAEVVAEVGWRVGEVVGVVAAVAAEVEVGAMEEEGEGEVWGGGGGGEAVGEVVGGGGGVEEEEGGGGGGGGVRGRWRGGGGDGGGGGRGEGREVWGVMEVGEEAGEEVVGGGGGGGEGGGETRHKCPVMASEEGSLGQQLGLLSPLRENLGKELRVNNSDVGVLSTTLVFQTARWAASAAGKSEMHSMVTSGSELRLMGKKKYWPQVSGSDVAAAEEGIPAEYREPSKHEKTAIKSIERMLFNAPNHFCQLAGTGWQTDKDDKLYYSGKEASFCCTVCRDAGDSGEYGRGVSKRVQSKAMVSHCTTKSHLNSLKLAAKGLKDALGDIEDQYVHSTTLDLEDSTQRAIYGGKRMQQFFEKAGNDGGQYYGDILFNMDKTWGECQLRVAEIAACLVVCVYARFPDIEVLTALCILDPKMLPRGDPNAEEDPLTTYGIAEIRLLYTHYSTLLVAESVDKLLEE